MRFSLKENKDKFMIIMIITELFPIFYIFPILIYF